MVRFDKNMETVKEILNTIAYISYSQLMVFDASMGLPGLDWKPRHTRQGFARRPSSASFVTLEEYGDVALRVTLGEFANDEKYLRVIAVPFEVRSGEVQIEGPEETNEKRSVHVALGRYVLTVAQFYEDYYPTTDVVQSVDVNFSPMGTDEHINASQIIKADSALLPEYPLLENADIASF
jgi:hypothetical protein